MWLEEASRNNSARTHSGRGHANLDRNWSREHVEPTRVISGMFWLELNSSKDFQFDVWVSTVIWCLLVYAKYLLLQSPLAHPSSTYWQILSSIARASLTKIVSQIRMPNLFMQVQGPLHERPRLCQNGWETWEYCVLVIISYAQHVQKIPTHDQVTQKKSPKKIDRSQPWCVQLVHDWQLCTNKEARLPSGEIWRLCMYMFRFESHMQYLLT